MCPDGIVHCQNRGGAGCLYKECLTCGNIPWTSVGAAAVHAIPGVGCIIAIVKNPDGVTDIGFIAWSKSVPVNGWGIRIGHQWKIVSAFQPCVSHRRIEYPVVHRSFKIYRFVWSVINHVARSFIEGRIGLLSKPKPAVSWWIITIKISACKLSWHRIYCRWQRNWNQVILSGNARLFRNRSTGDCSSDGCLNIVGVV